MFGFLLIKTKLPSYIKTILKLDLDTDGGDVTKTKVIVWYNTEGGTTSKTVQNKADVLKTKVPTVTT